MAARYFMEYTIHDRKVSRSLFLADLSDVTRVLRVKIVAYQILNDIPQAKRDGNSVRHLSSLCFSY